MNIPSVAASRATSGGPVRIVLAPFFDARQNTLAWRSLARGFHWAVVALAILATCNPILCEAFGGQTSPAGNQLDPRQIFQQALEAQKRGDLGAAANKYQELVKLHPEMTAAHANFGVVLVSLGRYDEAIVQYRAALQQVPGNRALQLNLALAYYKKGDIGPAAGELNALHEAEPGNVRIATLLGDCEAQLGQANQAVELLTPFEKANPEDLDLAWALGSALIRSGSTREGLERVQKVADQRQSATAYFLAAQSAFKLTFYDQAQRDINEAIRLDPNLPGAYTQKGIQDDWAGNQEGAVAAFTKALQSDANDFQAHLYLGAIAYVRRQLDEAKAHLQRALKLRPDSYVTQYELARVDRAQGNLEEAAKNLEAAVRAKPEWLPPHVELVALYYRLNRPDDGAREKKIVDQIRADELQRHEKMQILSPELPSQ